MLKSRTIAFLAAALTTTISLPIGAQQSRPGGRTSPGTAGAPPSAGNESADLSDATIGKVGAALRRVSAIQQEYSQRVQAAPTPEQQQGLAEQARRAATEAVTGQGLSVDQYARVIQLAQTDQSVQERVLAAARVAR